RSSYFFFFQAEDGIRDFHVTGVQTCALPIYCLLHGVSTCLWVRVVAVGDILTASLAAPVPRRELWLGWQSTPTPAPRLARADPAGGARGATPSCRAAPPRSVHPQGAEGRRRQARAGGAYHVLQVLRRGRGLVRAHVAQVDRLRRVRRQRDQHLAGVARVPLDLADRHGVRPVRAAVVVAAGRSGPGGEVPRVGGGPGDVGRRDLAVERHGDRRPRPAQGDEPRTG